MSIDRVELSEENVRVLARVSSLLGEGYEFVGYKGYMGGVQLNWKRGSVSVMWREEYGESVEVYDMSGSSDSEFRSFGELGGMS